MYMLTVCSFAMVAGWTVKATGLAIVPNSSPHTHEKYTLPNCAEASDSADGWGSTPAMPTIFSMAEGNGWVLLQDLRSNLSLTAGRV
jgi:hypothetical protein